MIARIRTMRATTARSVFTPATAASALIFFVLAMQCLPTLAVTRKETGAWRYAAFQLAYTCRHWRTLLPSWFIRPFAWLESSRS